jgi:hypothetical protein
MADSDTANVATASSASSYSDTTLVMHPIDNLDIKNTVLSSIQTKAVKKFFKDLRLCGTDSEKFQLCIDKRNHLLDQYTRLGILITAFERVMSAECEEYNHHKQSTKKAPLGNLERTEKTDAAQWERFTGVARDGSEAISELLSPFMAQITLEIVYSMLDEQLTERSPDSGPHKCERMNNATGRTCNATFSRPHDLTRHEDNVHSLKRQKFSCALCTKQKLLSRSDALVRHMRMVHGVKVRGMTKDKEPQ